MKSCEVTMLFAEAIQLRSLNIILSTPQFSPTQIGVYRVNKNLVFLTIRQCVMWQWKLLGSTFRLKLFREVLLASESGWNRAPWHFGEIIKNVSKSTAKNQWVVPDLLVVDLDQYKSTCKKIWNGKLIFTARRWRRKQKNKKFI